LLWLILVLTGGAWAYTVSSEALVSSGGIASSAAYSTLVTLSDGMAGPIGSTSTPTSDTTAPTIASILFDGQTIINNDLVKSNVAITANISDAASSIDTNKSSVEVNSQYYSFASLTGQSSFANGNLRYKPGFLDGTYYFRIHAYDTAGNYSSSEAIAFKVEGGEVKVSGAVLNYPNPFNPFNPAGQTTEINYMLNNDAEVIIYIYNLIGQSIKKISCAAGTEGGRAGYNRVAWNGESDFGEVVANDIYIARVTSGGRQIGKCKIAVLK
jgi:hypothetical protein